MPHSPAGSSIVRHQEVFSNTLSSGLLIRWFAAAVQRLAITAISGWTAVSEWYRHEITGRAFAAHPAGPQGRWASSDARTSETGKIIGGRRELIYGTQRRRRRGAAFRHTAPPARDPVRYMSVTQLETAGLGGSPWDTVEQDRDGPQIRENPGHGPFPQVVAGDGFEPS